MTGTGFSTINVPQFISEKEQLMSDREEFNGVKN